jgi:hypothetical protein
MKFVEAGEAKLDSFPKKRLITGIKSLASAARDKTFTAVSPHASELQGHRRGWPAAIVN